MQQLDERTREPERDKAVPATEGRSPGGWRLGLGMRRAVLTVHILSAGAWIGIDVVLGVLVFTALITDSTTTAAISYQALELFAVWPLVIAGLVCLASGVVLGLGTKYGLIRYWWVAIKLVLNVVLVGLVWFALRPGLAEAAQHGQALAAGASSDVAISDLVPPPIVSGLALTVATVLAVFKPWGRLRRSNVATNGAGRLTFRTSPEGSPRVPRAIPSAVAATSTACDQAEPAG